METSLELPRWKILQVSLIGIMSAIIANLIFYAIFSGLDAIPETVLSPVNNEPITAKAVLFDTMFFTLGASIVYVGFLLRVNQSVRRFRMLSVILLLLSFIYPLLIENIPLKMYLALNVMHIVAAVTIVGILTTFAKPTAQSP